MSKDSHDIFSYMYTNKIGVRQALFWIAWAFVAEKDNNMKFADQIFMKGQKYMAEPKDLLNKRYHQYQRRMTRRFLNATDIEEEEKPSKKPVLGVAPSSSSSSSSIRRGLGALPLAPNNSAINPVPSNSSSMFEIYDESSNAKAPKNKDFAPKWNNLGTENERRKENDGKQNNESWMKQFINTTLLTRYCNRVE